MLLAAGAEQKQKQQLEQPFEFPIGGDGAKGTRTPLPDPGLHPLSAPSVNELTQVLAAEELPPLAETSRTLSPEKSAICW